MTFYKSATDMDRERVVLRRGNTPLRWAQGNHRTDAIALHPGPHCATAHTTDAGSTMLDNIVEALVVYLFTVPAVKVHLRAAPIECRRSSPPPTSQ